jgi:hypothetical protein
MIALAFDAPKWYRSVGNLGGRAVLTIGAILQILESAPILLAAFIALALLFLALAVIVLYVSVKHKIPIEAKTLLYNLKIGNVSSPNSPLKLPHNVSLLSAGFRL